MLKEVKYFLNFKALTMELLDLPLPKEKESHLFLSVKGLRLSSIEQTVDIIDIDNNISELRNLIS